MCGARNAANGRWSEEAGLGLGEAPGWTETPEEKGELSEGGPWGAVGEGLAEVRGRIFGVSRGGS